jgi:dCTP diphosphatase
MPDATTTVAGLRDAMRAFAVEAAELMEHFLWMDNEDSREVANDPVRRTAIADEMADVACYLLALSNTLGIDLSEAITAKLAKNAVKYPAEKYRGRYRLEEEPG